MRLDTEIAEGRQEAFSVRAAFSDKDTPDQPRFRFDVEAHLATPPFYTRPADAVPAFLYIMRCERFVKVGIASDVQKRLIGLQGANPFPVSLARKYHFYDRSYAGFAERTCHATFAPARVFGEWFDVSFDEAAPLVAEIVRATKRLPSRHRAADRASEQALRLRYETDERYRAQVDARQAASARQYRYLVAREKAVEEAARNFDNSYREAPITGETNA